MEDMIKKLILVLILLVVFEHIVKERFQDDKTKRTQKYEYNGKYKDPKRERIVEHIGE